MRRRGFRPTRTIRLSEYLQALRNDWKPGERDFVVIKARLCEKLRKKDGWYRYHGEKRIAEFFLKPLEKDAGGL